MERVGKLLLRDTAASISDVTGHAREGE